MWGCCASLPRRAWRGQCGSCRAKMFMIQTQAIGPKWCHHSWCKCAFGLWIRSNISFSSIKGLSSPIVGGSYPRAKLRGATLSLGPPSSLSPTPPSQTNVSHSQLTCFRACNAPNQDYVPLCQRVIANKTRLGCGESFEMQTPSRKAIPLWSIVGKDGDRDDPTRSLFGCK